MKQLIRKVKKNKHTIGVVGLGYVGLPLCLRMINKRIKVVGVDNDQKKIKNLHRGISYISDIKNSDLKYFKKNKFHFSDNYEILKKSDVIIICLPTPLKNNKPDLSYLIKSFKQISNILSKNKVVILESTVYPGATEELSKIIPKKYKIGKDIFICYSPERENPGDNSFTYNTTPKIISGMTKNCKVFAEIIYKKFIKKVVLVETIKVAEMSKLLENTYRSVNISMVNEIKIICEKLNIDIYDVINAAATKNFGFQKFVPGPGVGGHCIPIDPFYLSWIASRNGYKSKFIRAAGEISNIIPIWIVRKITNFFLKKKKKLKKILLIGISYKANIGDDRESPAFEIMKRLKAKGIIFDYHDPYFKLLRIGRKNKISLKSISLKPSNIRKYDASIIVTDHDKINYELVFKNSNFIFDCRGRFKKYKNISNNKKIIYC